MTRQLRIEFPGAWYHVMNRGASRQNLFSFSEHFQYFLDLLSDIHETYGVEVHAYCLMNNHYHLLLRTPHGMLSRAMHYLNGMYARYYNSNSNKDGSIFKGRYKSILVDADNYFLQVSRYIHLNPVEASLVDAPEKYRWSSYRYYINQILKPAWLYCDETLSRFKDNCLSSYTEFVNDGISNKSADNESRQKISSILGTDDFIDRAKKYYTTKGCLEKIPDYIAIEKRELPKVEEIIKVVAAYFKILPADIINLYNRKKGNMPRKIALYLSSKFSGQTHESIAKNFSGINYKGVSCAKGRISNDIQNHKDLSEIVNNIIKLLPEKKW